MTLETLSNIGVVVALVYLAVQVRHHTVERRRSNARRTATEHATALHGMMDREIADIVFRGHQDLESLEPVERYRYDLAMLVWLQAVEQAFADYRWRGYIEDSLVPHRNTVPAVLNSPGGAVWWNQRKFWFSHSFRTDVAELLKNPPSEASRAGITPST